MTVDEMRAALKNAEQLGHEWIQFKIARARSPKNWDRVRVIPGLYGVCRGELESPHPSGSGYGRYLVDVLTKDAHRVLGRKTPPATVPSSVSQEKKP